MMAFAKRMLGSLRGRKTQLALAVRIAVAAVAAYAIARALHLMLPLWAVLTSLIVTQMSVGRSLKATRDYMLGTVGGAVYGGAIAMLIPHSGEGSLLALLVLAVAPMAFVGAINPSLSAATVTAVIVLLVPAMNHANPLDSTIDRLFEVTVGALTGLVVSFLVLPSRAVSQIRINSAQLLELLAAAFAELLAGLTRDRIDVRGLTAVFTECTDKAGKDAPAQRQQAALVLRLLMEALSDAQAIELGALDAADVGVVPLPANVQARLARPLSDVSSAIVDYMRAAAVALRNGSGAVDIRPVDAALQAYAAEVAALRSEGLIRGVPVDVAERFFALGFSLEQMRQNLNDLDRCRAEWCEKPATTAAGGKG